MKKLLTVFVLFSIFLVFAQKYQFDYKLTYKSISKERENTFTQFVNSKNPNIYVFFFKNQNDVYARLLDYDRNIGHTFHVIHKNEGSEFIYLDSNKSLAVDCIIKNVITEKLQNDEYDYKISFDYKYNYSPKKKMIFKIKLKNFESNLVLNYPMDFHIKSKKEIFSKMFDLEKGNYFVDKVMYNSSSLKESSEIEKINLKIVLPNQLNFTK